MARPLKFPTPEDMQKKVDEYFNLIEETGDIITITGLALHLDTCRQTLCRYDKRDEFSDTVKRAKMRVELSYEKSLRENGRAGDIFGLKNFDWSDKREIEHSGSLSDTLADLPPVDEDYLDGSDGD